MLIAISSTYRGHVLSRTLEPGEHEVPDHVGRYLLDTFSGPPFFVREVSRVPEVEVKPTRPRETKPLFPAETKRKRAPRKPKVTP